VNFGFNFSATAIRALIHVWPTSSRDLIDSLDPALTAFQTLQNLCWFKENKSYESKI
jgi:hypothetical protein